MIANVMES